MRIVAAEDIASVLTYGGLVEALAEAFRAGITAPPRHHHTIAQDGADATLLLMPAWTDAGERYLGCKIATIFPGNAKLSQPTLHGQYLLMSGETGEVLALLDARELTAWRTAAASALASRFLSREDAAHLLMVGAGGLAPHLVRAHGSVRPLTRVTIWNRSKAKAIALAFGLAVGGVEVEVADDLEEAVREADIVSCATLSATPLVKGAWLKKGAHLDLVGGFTPKMREADDLAVTRARVYVDTRAGAMKEAGDIAIPIRKGVLARTAIRGDLFELCRGKAKGRHSGRTSASQITLFKSVGTALEDLAAAMLVWKSLQP
jgi:ornithine cyclodeaminase